MTLHAPVDGVVGQMLNGIQGITPAADQVTQIVTHQVHLVGAGLLLIAVGHGLGIHVLQQALQEGFDLLLHGTGLGGGILPGLLLGFGFGLGGLGLPLLSGSLGDLGLPLGLGRPGGFRLGHSGRLGLGFRLGRLRLLLRLGSLGTLQGGCRLGLAAGGGAKGSLGSLGHGVRSLVGHLDLGRLGAEAQKALLRLLQHQDADAVPVQSQLV